MSGDGRDRTCSVQWNRGYNPAGLPTMPNVTMNRVLGTLAAEILKPPRDVRRRRFGAEEVCPHVVVEPDDVEALLGEIARRFGADQTPAAADDGNWHFAIVRSPSDCSGG
jgi:hypothetical protein